MAEEKACQHFTCSSKQQLENIFICPTGQQQKDSWCISAYGVRRLFSLRNHIWSVLEQKDQKLRYSWSVTGLQQPHVTLPHFWASTDKHKVSGNSNYWGFFSLLSSNSKFKHQHLKQSLLFYIQEYILRAVDKEEESCRLTPGLHTKLEMQYQPRWLGSSGTNFLRDHSKTEIVLGHLTPQHKQS